MVRKRITGGFGATDDSASDSTSSSTSTSDGGQQSSRQSVGGPPGDPPSFTDAQPSVGDADAPSGTPASGGIAPPPDDGGGSGGIDPSNPADAPSASPAPSAGDDAGETVSSSPPSDSGEAPVGRTPGSIRTGSDGTDSTNTGTSSGGVDAGNTTRDAAVSPADRVEGYPTAVPDVSQPSESGSAAVAEYFNRAQADSAVADAATSGGLSQLPLPTVDFREPAEQFRQLVEEREQGFTTSTATLPGVGNVPVGLRLDMSKEESADAPSDQVVEGALQSLNPAAAIEGTENIAEAADNPLVYARNPGATGETAAAAADTAEERLSRQARENPYGLAGSFIPAAVSGGATAATVARRGGSLASGLKATAKAELDPRVGPLGTTVETKLARSARSRLSDLPIPDNERGSMQLGKFRTRGKGDDADGSADVNADTASDDLGVPDNPFLVSDKRVYDPARSFDQPNDPNVDIDPTDPSGVSEQDIGIGISGQGNPQAAPGTTFEWDASTTSAADADLPADIRSPSLFGVSALSEAGEPEVGATDTLDVTADGSLAEVPTAAVDDSQLVGDVPFPEQDTFAGVNIGVDQPADVPQPTDVGQPTDAGQPTDVDVTPGVGVDSPTDVGVDQPTVTDQPTDVGQDTPLDTPLDIPQEPVQDVPPTDRPSDPPVNYPADPGRDPGRDPPGDGPRDPPTFDPDLQPRDSDETRRKEQPWWLATAVTDTGIPTVSELPDLEPGGDGSLPGPDITDPDTR